MNRYITFLLMGAPGSGKGTQGKVLGTVPRFFHCACGEVFRSLDLRTPIGQKFIDYSSKGLLVPDNLTVELWKTKIEAQVLEGEFKPDIDALVLDGIPRNVNQAKLMEELIDVKQVFHLSCPKREELVRRLRKRAIKDNRLDDANEEVIRRWDLVHAHGRRDGADISRPAEFLIDSSGKIRWVNLTDDFVVRARPREALAAFDAMSGSSRPGQ